MSEFINGFGEDVNKVQAYSGGDNPQPLKAGGYILQIRGAKIQRVSTGASKIVFAFDIMEGDQKDYFQHLYEYKKRWNNNPKWLGTFDCFIPDKGNGSEEALQRYQRSLQKLKGAVTAINDSNPHSAPIDIMKSFSLDEFQRKVVGGIFGDKEWNWNGRTGMRAECRWFISASRIHSGDFIIPDPQYLTSSPPSQSSDFGNVISDGDVPF